MQFSLRAGKVNPILVALVPPIAFLAGLMVYKGFRTVVPSAFSIDSTQRVEAMEVIKGVSPTTSKGLPIPQTTSLRSGGSSRLVIARAASNGAHMLVAGSVSAGFLAEKNELDNMLHFKFSRSNLRVESDGQPVEAVLLFPRTHTEPLRVDDPSTNPEVSVMDLLYANTTLKPIPPGFIEGTKYESDNGMVIQVGMGFGKSGALNLGERSQLNITLDSNSTAWVEMPSTVRQQHTAIGSEPLEVGLLIPLKGSGSGPFVIKMFGDEVATIPRG